MATDMDTVMGPPSAPPPLSSAEPHAEAQQEIIENQKNLKRRHNELEEEHNLEPKSSGVRDVQLSADIDNILNELQGMQKNAKLDSNGSFTQGSVTSQVHVALASASTSPSTKQNMKVRRREEETHEGHRDIANGDSTSVTAPHTNGSPSTQTQTPPESGMDVSQPGTDVDGDIEMEYGVELSSGHFSDSPHHGQQTPKQVAQADGTPAIAAVAAAVVETEAAAMPTEQPEERLIETTLSNTTDIAPSDTQDVQADKPNLPAETSTHQAQASSSTLTHALGQSSSSAPSQQSANGDDPVSTSITSPSTSSHTEITHHPPSMENILKVAEAAVAAQNAAKLAAMSSTAPKAPANLNFDPTLVSESSKSASPSVSTPAQNGNNTPAAASKSPPPPANIDTSAANATASSSTTTPSSAATPTSNLSNNPYLSLSTNLLSRTPGSATPTGHPMLLPYPLFYSPGTPITPNSPTYPIYNPYYYLASPIPGPNGMYPPPPTNFPPPAQQQRPPPPGDQQRAKPKRLKAHTVTTRSFSIPMVPRDKKGKPMLPLNVGIMTVINLGEVCMREHFHTERYIFPVGYEVTRRYLSTVDSMIEVVYHCTILDGGDGPKFQIIPSDRPDKPIIAGTATGAWSNIVKQANAIRNRQHSNSVSGPDFFGLGQNTIKHLIQELANSDRLRDYVWQNIVEGGPLGGRHAAVIPALPEEYDASLPLGAYYPKRDVNPNPNIPRGMSHYPQHIIAQAEAQKAQRLAAQQAQQQQQQQPIGGPSGSGSASSLATTPQQINHANPLHDPAQIMLSLGATGGGLNIQEYQPPQNQNQNQSQSISEPGAERRTTRSGGVANTNSPSSPSAPTAARQTRAARGTQQQQSGQASVNVTEVSALNADGTMTTTFASIMNAYPAPGVPAAMSGQTTASTS